MTLYQTDWCPYCARVRETLSDLNLQYEIVNVPDEHDERTELQKTFGTTGVPSLIDGDVKIADDDDAIIAYVEETYRK